MLFGQSVIDTDCPKKLCFQKSKNLFAVYQVGAEPQAQQVAQEGPDYHHFVSGVRYAQV